MTKLKSSPLKNINVEQNKKGIFTIQWDTPVKDISISIFAGDSPDTINRKVSVAKVKGKKSVSIDGLDPDARHYFELVPEGGQRIITAERGQPFEGIVNFRDLGGYETTDGRRVKWGEVFRSGHLSRVTDKDKALLEKMGMRVVCDFRTPGEIKAQPDWLPEDGSVNYRHFPIVHGEFDPVAAMESLQKGDISWLTEDFIINRYIQKIDLAPYFREEINFLDVAVNDKFFRQPADVTLLQTFHSRNGIKLAVHDGIMVVFYRAVFGQPVRLRLYFSRRSEITNHPHPHIL